MLYAFVKYRGEIKTANQIGRYMPSDRMVHRGHPEFHILRFHRIWENKHIRISKDWEEVE